MTTPELAVDSAAPAAVTCLVCGNEIARGEGVTERFGGRVLRFKCPGCLSRFRADPDRYLGGGPASCCGGEGHAGAAEAQCAAH